MKRTELKRGKPLKQGRGFAASRAQRDKVEWAGECVFCGAVPTANTTLDPAHLCPRGRGGCDHSLCVVPLCRTSYGTGCHGDFDAGKIDLLPVLEPRYRDEVAHCVEHMGLENARVRLAPSQYGRGVSDGNRDAA